jgi:hypothetical protein
MKTDVFAMENLFHNKLEEQKYRKLNNAQKAYARKLSRLGLKVTIIVQDLQEGMGHAVVTAEGEARAKGTHFRRRHFPSNNYRLLVLTDHPDPFRCSPQISWPMNHSSSLSPTT